MHPERRTQESEKRHTEELIVEALVKSDPLNPRQRRLGFTELLKSTNLARATLNRALKSMRAEEKIRRDVDATGESVKIYYRPGPKASVVYPLIPTRKYYEDLANKFDVDKVTAEQFVKQLQKALDETLFLELLESIIKQRPVLADPILEEFKFHITRFVVYRRNSKADINEFVRGFQDLQDHPERYREELRQLQEAVS